MSGISNKYMEKLMGNFDLNFKGVFSSDYIPFFSGYNFSLICNLSKTKEKGTHFVAMYVSKNSVIYFDPFGLKCHTQSICLYLEMYKRKIIESLVTIQHPLSFHCGFYCIGFVFALDYNLSLSEYQNIFGSTNLDNNDNIVSVFITTMIKYTHKK